MTIQDPLKGVAFDWTYKGLPNMRENDFASAIEAGGLSLFDDRILFPVATLSRPRLDRNRTWMRTFVKRTGVNLAPHGKTTMAPALMRMQIEDGAWGITAATPHHVRAYRRFGINRIIMANQLIGRAGVRLIVEELEANPEFEFYCIVDNPENAAFIAETVKGTRCSRPIRLLIEMGAEGGRTGVRKVTDAVALAETISGLSPHVELCGVECFEGIVGGPDKEPNASAIVQKVADAAIEIDRRDLFAAEEVILTAGGSAFFDRAMRILSGAKLSRPTNIIIRSGCYIAHDHGLYDTQFQAMKTRDETVGAIDGSLEGALHVWGYVQSAPEKTRLICGVGKRDVGDDIEPPRPLAFVRDGDPNSLTKLGAEHRVVALNDQHAYLDTPPDTPLQIGDVVCFGVSHPCTTFDKWRSVYIINDDFQLADIVRTYF